MLSRCSAQGACRQFAEASGLRVLLDRCRSCQMLRADRVGLTKARLSRIPRSVCDHWGDGIGLRRRKRMGASRHEKVDWRSLRQLG
jgi:hypothetical protein